MKCRPCACIDTLYIELPFLERIAAAGRDGFAAVEFWSWQDRDMAVVRRAAEAAGIRVAGFNGDGPFSLIDPGQREAYLAYLARSMDAAKAAGAASLTIHSNALGEGGVVTDRGEGLSDTVRLCALYEGLKACAAMAEDRGIMLHLEALNPITDHPGNFLVTTAMAAELTALVGSPRLKILYDIYHMQLSEGNLMGNIRAWHGQIGHVHAADAPGRHEPGTGEIAFSAVLDCLETAGYDGLVGFELFPAHTTAEAVAAIMSL